MVLKSDSRVKRETVILDRFHHNSDVFKQLLRHFARALKITFGSLLAFEFNGLFGSDDDDDDDDDD